MVEECRSCLSIHFLFSLYSRENEQRERKERAVRTEQQCTLPLSSLTTSTGGLGYCEFGVKYFKGGVGLGWGWASWLGSGCVSEMKYTWFPALPLIRGFVADATGVH